MEAISATRHLPDPFIAKLIIDRNGIRTENASRSLFSGAITLDNFEPTPKNPTIADFFHQIGRADELGSGTRNLTKYSAMYSGKAPTLTEGDVFVAQVPVPWNTQIDSAGVRDTPSGVRDTAQKVRDTPSGVRDTPSGVAGYWCPDRWAERGTSLCARKGRYHYCRSREPFACSGTSSADNPGGINAAWSIAPCRCGPFNPVCPCRRLRTTVGYTL